MTDKQKLTTFSFAHMPKQEGAGRLAQRGTGLVAATQITARNEPEARKVFAETFPQREITAVGILGKASK